MHVETGLSPVLALKAMSDMGPSTLVFVLKYT